MHNIVKELLLALGIAAAGAAGAEIWRRYGPQFLDWLEKNAPKWWAWLCNTRFGRWARRALKWLWSIFRGPRTQAA